MPELQQYQNKIMDRKQFGFRSGISIAECKRLLFK